MDGAKIIKDTNIKQNDSIVIGKIMNTNEENREMENKKETQ